VKERNQVAFLKSFLTEIMSPLDSACCITGDGELLDLHYETLADIGTLATAAQTVIKYFPLKLGDAILMNDPYSGGTTLSYMTIITPLVKGDGQFPDLYLALRTGFRPRLLISKALDEEGLRIPPTPLVQNRIINRAVMDAMAAHPLCPEGLFERIDQLLNGFWPQLDLFQKLNSQNKFLSRQLIKNYLKESRDSLSMSLSELPHAETKVEKRLSSGELIRLRLELTAEKIKFDFTGTSASKRLCLTDSATFGTCFGALIAFLQKPLPINSGTFSMIEVVSPLGCLLNSKFPSPTFKGMTEGANFVASLIAEALSEIFPHKSVSGSSQVPTQIGFEFSNGKRFFDSLPGGIGATAHQDGSDSIALWVRNRLQNSVQEIEVRFPMRIQNIGIRKESGGLGTRKGGNGLTKQYELLDSAHFYWMMEGTKTGAPGLKGGTNGSPPEIKVHLGEKQITIDKEEGDLFLESGTIVTVQSGGGGGFGKI
jgi:N-methylhydantoinase B